MRHVYLIVISVMLASAMMVRAQDVTVATRATGAVLLHWMPDTTQPLRYNVYRKRSADAAFPSAPLHARPLGVVTCTELPAIVPASTPEWRAMVACVLDSSTARIDTARRVCDVLGGSVRDERFKRMAVLARYVQRIGSAMGTFYVDATAAAGTRYDYEVRAIGADGSERPVAARARVSVTSGRPVAMVAPTNVRAIAGDAMVQVLWRRAADVFVPKYILERSTSSSGPWTRVNRQEYSFDVVALIDGDSVAMSQRPTYGHTDDDTASGMRNGTRFYYRVLLEDDAGVRSPASDVVNATPQDRTPPLAPREVTAEASRTTDRVDITFRRTYYDERGRAETMRTYKVYRYDGDPSPRAPSTLVATVSEPVAIDTSRTIRAVDLTARRDVCRGVTFSYRVFAVDANGNTSAPSVAVATTMQDTTPPASVRGTRAEGGPDRIKVMWQGNTDCGVRRYNIYRALCDWGDWTPCPDSADLTWTRKYLDGIEKDQRRRRDPEAPRAPVMRDRTCGGPFLLVGSVEHRAGTPEYMYEDVSVPAASVICYAYLVTAQDSSGNQSGQLPWPDVRRETIVCQRLRDRTPPEPAVITGLLARDSAIIIDFIAPPAQDIAAYHIYRSESAATGFAFVGGIEVVPGSTDGRVITRPFGTGTTIGLGCDYVPLASAPWMGQGRFTDRGVRAHKPYWYKVVPIDRERNEAVLDSAVALSTSTYISGRDVDVTIDRVAAATDGVALTITMRPPASIVRLKAYAVFRARSEGGPYRQIGTATQSLTYTDRSVLRGEAYWYRAMVIYTDERHSDLCPPVMGRLP